MLHKNFTQTGNDILEDTRLSRDARFLYVLLRKYAWQKDHCYPGQAKLAELMGCCEVTLRVYIQELIDHKYIEVKRQGFGRTNRYILLSTNEETDDQDHKETTDQEVQKIYDHDSAKTYDLDRKKLTPKEYSVVRRPREKEDPEKEYAAASAAPEQPKTEVRKANEQERSSLISRLKAYGLNSKDSAAWLDYRGVDYVTAMLGRVDTEHPSYPRTWLLKALNDGTYDHAPRTGGTSHARTQTPARPVAEHDTNPDRIVQQAAAMGFRIISDTYREDDLRRATGSG